MRRIIFIIVAIFVMAVPALALADRGPGGSFATASGDQSQTATPPGEAEPGDDSGSQFLGGDDRPGNPFEFGRRSNFGSPEDDDLGDDQDAFFYAGEVTAVDAAAGTLTLKVRWPGDHGRHHGRHQLRSQSEGADDSAGDDNRPQTTTITVKTDANTAIFRNGADATLADIVAGDVVHVVIVGDEGQTREEALASPAFAIMARARKTTVTYGFAGRVKAVDTAAGTLTLTVTKATRRARALLGSDATQDVTFTIGESTILILDGDPAELGDYKPGDAAAIGVKASKTVTLAELAATPARVVLGQKANVNPTTTAGSARLRKLSVRAAKAVR